MAASPIPVDEFEPSVRGDASVFFPPQAYYRPDFYKFEQAAVWRKDWVCVGRQEEVANVGDYFSVEVAGEPLLVVRTEPDGIAAMSAVCRHRAMLVAEGSGNCKGYFVCPYHGWSYDRRGNLVGAPGMAGAAGFDRGKIRLPRVRVELWHGMIFVNFDAAAAPLAPRLAALEPIIADWRLETLVGEFSCIPNYKQHFDYPWNWKVYAEGQSECYHCDKLHRDTPCMRGVDFSSIQMLVNDAEAGVFAFSMRTKVRDLTLNHLGHAVFPVLESLPDAQRWMSYSIIIAPNVFMQLMADSVILLSWLPTGPTTMRSKRHRLYPESTLRRPDFHDVHKLELEAIRYFVGQDDMAFARVQTGLQSDYAPRGPITAREPVLLGLNKWLVERYRRADRAA